MAVPNTKSLPPAEAARLDSAAADASTSAFHLGVLIAAVLMILGGIASGFGIEDPKQRARLSLVAQRATKSNRAAGDAEDASASEPA